MNDRAPVGARGLGLAATTDGRLLSVDYNKIEVWDLALGQRAATIEIDGSGALYGLSASADGTRALVLDRRRETSGWIVDIPTGTALPLPLTVADGVSGRIRAFATAAAMSVDGSNMVLADQRGVLLFTDAIGTALWTLKLPESDSPKELAFRPDGQRIAIVSFVGTVSFVTWSGVIAGDPIALCTTGKCFPYGISWSPSGETLAVTFRDRTVVLDESGTRLAEIPNLLGDNAETDSSRQLVSWSPDGSLLHLAADGTEPIRYDVENRVAITSPFARHDASISAAALSPDHSILATATEWSDGVIRTWSATTGAPGARLSHPQIDTYGRNVRQLEFDKAGKHLYVLYQHGVAVWDITAADLVHTMDAPHAERFAVGPGGEVAVSTSDGRLLVYGHDGAPLFERAARAHSPLVWCAEGLLFRAPEGFIVVDDHTGESRSYLDNPPETGIVGVAEVDGGWMGWTHDGEVWKLDGSRTPSFNLGSHQAARVGGATGTTIVAVVDDHVELWDLALARRTVSIPGHGPEHIIQAVAVSADGLRVATGADDTLANVWRIDP